MKWISIFEFYIISTSFGGTLLVCLWCICNKLFSKLISTNGTYFVFRAIIFFYLIPIVYFGRFYDMLADKELLSSVPIIGLINPSMSKILFLPFIVWLAGSIITLGYNIYTHLYFYFKVLRYNALVIDGSILETEYLIRKKLRFRRAIPIYYNEFISSPMLAGILFPKILLPVSFPKEDLVIMLYHENIHYKQHDLLFKKLGSIILCLHWFNPFVYMLAKLINEWCEFNCDNLCCLHHDFFKPKEYASTLVKLATAPRMSFSLHYSAFAEKTSQLEPRIQRIVTNRRGIKHARILAVMVSIVYFAFGSITVNAASNGVLTYYYDWYYGTSTHIKEELINMPSVSLVTQSPDEANKGVGVDDAPSEDISDVMPSYFWRIKKNNGINCMKVDCKKGQVIYISHFMVQQDIVLHHGIMDLDGNIHYVDGSSFIEFKYVIPADGTYTIFAQNPNDEDININGTYFLE
jgi:beta-lactamase regulating signal transducer with metallopeptidase domain